MQRDAIVQLAVDEKKMYYRQRWEERVHLVIDSWFFLGFEWRDSRVSLQVLNFLSPRRTVLVLRFDCSKAELTNRQRDLSIWKLVELKMLDFSDCKRTGISILTWTTDKLVSICQLFLSKVRPRDEGKINYEGPSWLHPFACRLFRKIKRGQG